MHCFSLIQKWREMFLGTGRNEEFSGKFGLAIRRSGGFARRPAHWQDSPLVRRNASAKRLARQAISVPAIIHRIILSSRATLARERVSRMTTCLNLISLGRETDQLAGIKAAAQAGFDSVGIWADAIESQSDPLAYAADIALACADHGLAVAEMCYVGGWMWENSEPTREALEVAKQRARLASASACPQIIACAAGGVGDLDAAAQDFSGLCDVGSEEGVDFALEYIGMSELVKDLKTGLDIVKRADHPRGKLLIDTFHTFRGGSTVDEFSLPAGDEVGLVHINDAPAGNIFEMADSDRVMPGDGAFPLTDALSRLQANGYDGGLSVEVFSEAWWSRPAEQTARAAYEGLRSVMPS